MKEWPIAWYGPLVLLGAGLLALLTAAVAGMEVFTADAPRAVAPRLWTTPLVRVEQALEKGDTAAALSWWREAQAVALRSGQWEGMVDIGDAAQRLAPDDTGIARQAYLAALFRARQQRSLDGILRVAIAFADLGDREAAAHALRLAELEARLDPQARGRVRSTAERWLSPTIRTEDPQPITR
jgi:hypothetical protein